MTRIEQALRLAVVAHAEQTRKTDGSPYIVHPIMVAQLLMTYGASEDVIVAALLHDVREDTAVTSEQVRAVAGPVALRIVEAVSENKSLPFTARKEAYVDAVRQGGESVWLVSVADKIHNAESLLDHVAVAGLAAWQAFNQGKEEKLWFETLLYTTLATQWDHPLLTRYGVLIEELRLA